MIPQTKYTIPPIIENWIESLNDSSIPLHIKENTIMMMESVSLACQTEVRKFRMLQQNRFDKRHKRHRLTRGS